MLTSHFDTALFERIKPRFQYAGFVLLVLGALSYVVTGSEMTAALFVFSGVVILDGLRRFSSHKLPLLQSYQLTVDSEQLTYENHKNGYLVTRPLSAITRVTYREIIRLPVVTVDMAGNERLRFVCFTEPEQLLRALNRQL
ncbi:hypothetical protein ACFSJ3_08595 [Corallincola platygyrae]|uniref:PH domain-containing protein n=1 Tax=Corallincola platygyrae TaxID=1193278 RepID=A0ABW4XML1_9GAMM